MTLNFNRATRARKPTEIERAFKCTANGKRSRFYSGASQVRAIPVEAAPGFKDGTPDVEGISGYATKHHYNPPVKERMLEGFVSWLLVTDAIRNNSKTVAITGVRQGIKTRCPQCGCFQDQQGECSCSHDDHQNSDLGVVHSGLLDKPDLEVDKVDIPSSSSLAQFVSSLSEGGLSLYLVLNSPLLTIWKTIRKQVQKKILDKMPGFRVLPVLTRLFSTKAQGP